MAMHVASAAFFSPRTRPPPEDYLADLRSFLRQSRYGTQLLGHVATLDTAWPLFANENNTFQASPNGRQQLSFLVDWANGGAIAPVCGAKSGIVALPLLLVLQLGQYLRYLECHSISHEQFIGQVQHHGGIHGYCGGAAAALSIACAKDEGHVIENAAVFLRVLTGIGAVMEAVDGWTSPDPTTIALRLKYEDQGHDLVAQFPGVGSFFRCNTMIIRLTSVCRPTYLPSPNPSQ